MQRTAVKAIYADMTAFAEKEVTVGGWVRNLRDSKAFGFIDLNDGSCFKSAQVVFEREKLETMMRSPRRISARRSLCAARSA